MVQRLNTDDKPKLPELDAVKSSSKRCDDDADGLHDAQR